MRNKFRALLQFSYLILALTALSCASPKPVVDINQTGKNQESAIIIDAAGGEYHWINEHYQNARILTQEVIQQSGKSYNVITIRTEEEERKTFYFDISRFSKKK